MWFQPGTLKVNAVFWCKENLTESERIAVRLAYGQSSDLSIPVQDSALEGELTYDSIPFDLRVPGERIPVRSSA